MRKYDLKPQYTRAKSTYGKAVVYVEDNGDKHLTSYDTLILTITNNNELIKHWDGYSQTTMRHINEFLKQNGLNAMNKQEWLGL